MLKRLREQIAALMTQDNTPCGAEDVLIKVKKTGICGTDIHIWNWDEWAARTVPVPLVTGHEFAGEIVAMVGQSGSGKSMAALAITRSGVGTPAVAVGTGPSTREIPYVFTAADFELRAVRHGRRFDYEIVSKIDGSVLGFVLLAVTACGLAAATGPR